MNRNIAENLMTGISLLDSALDRNAHIIESIEDEAERKEFRLAIATVIGEVYLQLIVPIVKQYPDLDPDKE